MGRLFHTINASKVFYGTVASSLRCLLSSYYPFQTNNSLKKDKGSKGLERKKGSGRSFLHRPASSVIVRHRPMIECRACDKAATHMVNVRYSNEKTESHEVCLKHFNIATNKLMIFLKHLRRKAKAVNK